VSPDDGRILPDPIPHDRIPHDEISHDDVSEHRGDRMSVELSPAETCDRAMRVLDEVE
jgi:hypothetical protein